MGLSGKHHGLYGLVRISVSGSRRRWFLRQSSAGVNYLHLRKKEVGEKKRRGRLEEVLDEFPTVDINQKNILNAYALIDAWTHGKHLDFAEHDFPPPKPAISMSKNDLWIAATAYASNATLLSTDKDFAHLHDKWINFVYIDPKMSLPEN